MSRLPALNDQQQAVALALTGDVFVAAGAGSGKTRVLAERFAQRVLLDEGRSGVGDAMAGTLLITFTDKAAGELAERVRRVLLSSGRPDLARSVDRAWISTIHSFCQRIVRRHAIDLGMDPGFTVLDETEAGLIRAQAFEVSARVARDAPHLMELSRSHGVADVRSYVLSGLDRVRAMGATVGDVRAPQAPDLAREAREVSQQLAGLTDDYRGLRRTATVEANLVAACDVSERLGRLEPYGGRPALDEELLSATDGIRLRRSGGDEMKELTQRLSDGVCAVRSVAARSIAARHATAYIEWLRIYADAFAEAKRVRNALDFEDLQMCAGRLFRERPDIAKRYAQQFGAVMIDEFQDTNELQMRVIGPLAAGCLCVVGDEKQSIYSFRYADVQVFLETRRELAERGSSGYHELAVNYRTHEDLLRGIDALFASGPLFGEAFLRLAPGPPRETAVRWPDGEPRAELLLVDTRGWQTMHWREAEAAALADRLAGLVRDGIAVPRDIVVLLRAMTTAGPYIRALEARGMRVYADAGGFFAAREVADMRALLRVMADALDGEGVVRLLSGGLGGLTDDALFLLAATAGRRGDLWFALGSAADAGLSGPDLERALRVHETVERLRREQGRLPLGDAILEGCSKLAVTGGSLSDDAAWANVGKMVRIAEAFERVVPADTGAFLRYLDDRELHAKRERSAGVAAENADAVRVMTVHAAKGLEFPVVAVADLGHGEPRFEDRILVVREDGDPVVTVRPPGGYGEIPLPPEYERARAACLVEDTEEAKRVLYVACTRAEQALILAGSADLSKPPAERTPIGWLREALGDPREECIADQGGIAVHVLTAENEAALLSTPSSVAALHAATQATDSGSVAEQASAARRADPEVELSYSAIGLYERCPYRFYAQHVLRLSSCRGRQIAPSATHTARQGSIPADPRELGSAFHAAMQLIAEGRAPDEERLAALATRHGLGVEEVERLRSAADTATRSSAVVAALAAGARPEAPFALPVAGGLLTGAMDLYVRDGEKATIVDYKTGASEPGMRQRDGRFRAQAECYALAALFDGAAHVDVVFVEVERSGRQTVHSFESEDRERLAARVEAVFENVAAERFERRAEYDRDTCSECPALGSLCGVRARNAV